MKGLKNNKYFQKLLSSWAIRSVYSLVGSFIYYGFKENCGGRNNSVEAFAGNLINEGLSEDQINKIYFNLIMKNGTCKMTNPVRNQDAINKVLEQISKKQNDQKISILEIGASNGIDAFNNFNNIQTIAKINKYVLGDLYTEVLLDRKRNLVFDQDGRLLQVLKNNYFVNINFRFSFIYQRITNLSRYIQPLIFKAKYRFKNIDLVKIPLVHPVIAKELSKGDVFHFQRLDVFQPISEKFDIIICLNLLIDQYFSERVIQKGVNNLISTLNPDGFIVIGTTTKQEIVFPQIAKHKQKIF